MLLTDKGSANSHLAHTQQQTHGQRCWWQRYTHIRPQTYEQRHTEWEQMVGLAYLLSELGFVPSGHTYLSHFKQCQPKGTSLLCSLIFCKTKWAVGSYESAAYLHFMAHCRRRVAAFTEAGRLRLDRHICRVLHILKVWRGVILLRHTGLSVTLKQDSELKRSIMCSI